MLIPLKQGLEPEILCMDEPFSQVDALTAETLRAEVLDIRSCAEINPTTVFMVSHDIKIEIHKEFGHLINITKAAEFLDFVDTPKQKILLTELGKRFVESDTEGRKRLWKEQLQKLAIYRRILDMLKKAIKGRLERGYVEEELVLHMPQEDPVNMFNILTGWARYGVLFAFSED